MASAWGSSWGSAWGNAWGSIAVVSAPPFVETIRLHWRVTMQPTSVFFQTDISDNIGGQTTIKDYIAART